MLYHVYIWKDVTSVEADIYESLDAEDAQEATFATMRKHSFLYAHYVWVFVSDEVSVDLYFVVCPPVPGVSD